MADLRIVDALEIPTENITGEEKLPTGGNGNYSITLDSVADYTKTKKDLVDNTTVDNKVNGVRQELEAHTEDLLNPHQVTKGQVGLGNVDNTADADKPVSNSTRAAIISAVSPKADKTYVDNQLTLKANKTYVDNQLTLKANKTDVYTKSETYTKQESSDLVNNRISTALTPINTSLDLAKRGVANRYNSSLTYNSGERVVLSNGDIVKSTVDGNTNNPNVNMNGWVSDFDTSAIQAEISTINTELSLKADTAYVDAAVGAISTDASKQYVTLALANADIANIALNQNVFVSEAVNGGYWYKATAGATTLTKSPYDPLAQAKLYADSKTESFKKNSAESLFDFNDSEKNTVAKILANGDLVLANLGDEGISEHIKNLRSVAANTSENQSILELRDLDGNLVFNFTDSGDLIFGGGESLKALANKEGDSVVRIPSRYELLTDEFNLLVSSYRNLSHISDLPIPIGLCGQKFKISNKTDFLNLKISQPERIKINTPYFADDHIVHPFLCNFYREFRGFKHLLILTPYHNTQDIFENPCVYGSNDLLNFELLSDMPQPIYERYPDSYNYNSDSFGVYDHVTGEFCVCWRNGSTAAGFDLWISRTTDGTNWSERKQLLPKSLGLILSPNIIFNSTLNKWVMYSISNDVIHESFAGNKFNYRLAENLHSPWSEPIFIDTPFTSWHQETRYCGNQFITIINDSKITGQLYLGISNDGLTWEFNNIGLIEGAHLNSYKASIVPSVIESSVQFDIFWTSSNVANGDDLWQLFHAKTQPIKIEGA